MMIYGIYGLNMVTLDHAEVKAESENPFKYCFINADGELIIKNGSDIKGGNSIDYCAKMCIRDRSEGT